MIRSYRDLKVWQLAMDLAECAYRQSQSLPRSEMYGLTSQIRRAATSVPANIAEGYGRDATGSYILFLKMARGSLKEFETHVLIAERVGLMDQGSTAPMLQTAEDIGRMLNALIRSLKTRQQG
jgi:four helix bundle protein